MDIFKKIKKHRYSLLGKCRCQKNIKIYIMPKTTAMQACGVFWQSAWDKGVQPQKVHTEYQKN